MIYVLRFAHYRDNIFANVYVGLEMGVQGRWDTAKLVVCINRGTRKGKCEGRNVRGSQGKQKKKLEEKSAEFELESAFINLTERKSGKRNRREKRKVRQVKTQRKRGKHLYHLIANSF